MCKWSTEIVDFSAVPWGYIIKYLWEDEQVFLDNYRFQRLFIDPAKVHSQKEKDIAQISGGGKHG